MLSKASTGCSVSREYSRPDASGSVTTQTSAPLTFSDLTTAANNVTVTDGNHKTIALANLTSHGQAVHLWVSSDGHTLYGYVGNPPSGNTVNRAPIDAKPAQNVPEIVVSDLMEGIGIALDVPGDRMFVTDLAGSLYVAKLDGTDKRMLLAAQGNLTGVAYVEI